MNGANIVDLVFEPFALSSVEGSYNVLPQRNEAPYVRIDVASGNKGKRGEREG